MEPEPPVLAGAGAETSRKRPRCVCAANDVLVEELSRLRARVRDPTSHLSANYARAIASVMRHEAPIRDGRQAKAELRNVGNYLANQIQAVLQRKGLLQASAQAEQHAIATTTPAVATPTAPLMAPVATSVSTDVATKVYAPTYRKRTWTS